VVTAAAVPVAAAAADAAAGVGAPCVDLALKPQSVPKDLGAPPPASQPLAIDEGAGPVARVHSRIAWGEDSEDDSEIARIFARYPVRGAHARAHASGSASVIAGVIAAGSACHRWLPLRALVSVHREPTGAALLNTGAALMSPDAALLNTGAALMSPDAALLDTGAVL